MASEPSSNGRGPVRIALKVVPGASRSGIAGWLGDSLKVRVKAQAESGKANAAVVTILSRALSLNRSEVVIVSGHSSPRKVVAIHNLPDAEVQERLRKAFRSAPR